MNHKFTLLTLALALISSVSASAADYLVVKNADTSSEYKLVNVKSLTFANGNMELTTLDAEAQSTFQLSDKLVITFSNVSTGIATLPTGRGDNAKPVYSDGILTMDGANGAQAMLFNTAGQCVRRINNWDGSAVSVDQLPTGVYIFKVNQQTIKFVKQ